MLNTIIDIGKVLHNSGIVDWPVEPIETVPFCNNGYNHVEGEEECISVGYSMIGESKDINDPKYTRYHDLMKIFTKNQGFKYNKDVKPLTAGKQKDLENYIG